MHAVNNSPQRCNIMFSFLPGCSEVFSQLVVRLRTVIEGNTQQLENKELL
jgi:hypothetical protein